MQSSLATLLGHPLLTWLENKLLADVVAQGADSTQAQSVIKEVLAQKSILDWLASVNWGALIQLILQILVLIPKQ